MVVLSWGDLTLSVDPSKIYTFNGFDWTLGFKSEDKAVDKKKPKAAAKAPQREQINFSVWMSKGLGVDVAEEIGKWRTACNAGTANELALGEEAFGDATSKWRIKSLKVSDVEWGAQMQIVAAKLTLGLEEVPVYPKAKKKKKKKSSSSSKKKKKPSSTVPNSTAGGRNPDGTPFTDKYEENRKPSNMRATRPYRSGPQP